VESCPPGYADGYNAYDSGYPDGIELDNYSASNEEEWRIKALWRAVLVQALLDAKNPSKKTAIKLYHEQAEDWLFGNGCDFNFVCMMADLEPGKVKWQAKLAKHRGYKWRKGRR